MVDIDESILEMAATIDELVSAVDKSTIHQSYVKRRQLLERDSALLEQIKSFDENRQIYLQDAAYGRYAPGFLDKQRTIMAQKRQLDLNPVIADFKYSETQLQTLFDQIGLNMADSISKRIKVAAGSPFFETKRRPHGRK